MSLGSYPVAPPIRARARRWAPIPGMSEVRDHFRPGGAHFYWRLKPIIDLLFQSNGAEVPKLTEVKTAVENCGALITMVSPGSPGLAKEMKCALYN